MTNSVVHDRTVVSKPLHLDLNCLQMLLFLSSGLNTPHNRICSIAVLKSRDNGYDSSFIAVCEETA